VFVLLLLSSIYISIVDIKTHKVRNQTLILVVAVFAVTTFFGQGPVHLASSIIIFLLGLIAMCFGLGAGDVKLAALLALFFLPLEMSRWSDFIQGFFLAGALHLIGHLVSRRSLADPIALAPAICAAFIWCAR
jgi:Flp pilus assembly protein protease CpaA